MNRFLQIRKNSDESVLKTAKMEYKFYYLLFIGEVKAKIF